MSNLNEHAMREFRIAGWVDENGVWEEEYQMMLCEHVLKLLEVFADEGHSGSTAPYALNLFSKLARFDPITPLTGEDDEWMDVSQHCGGGQKLFQNKRRSSVFKDETGAYDIDGKVFWEWTKRQLIEDEEGYPGEKVYKSYYTSRESRVPVTFPYVVPDKPIYEYRHSDAEPRTAPQTEEGFIDDNAPAPHRGAQKSEHHEFDGKSRLIKHGPQRNIARNSGGKIGSIHRGSDP